MVGICDAMITYLYGTDTYRIKAYLAEHAEGAQTGEEALKYRGLFGEAGPVVLYGEPEMKKVPENVAVFIVSEKKIKKGIEFKPLQGAEISTWISMELKKENFTIAPDALALLARGYRDTWYMKLELDKLCNYANERKNITAQDVLAVTTAKIEQNIFQLTDAIANQRKRDAVVLLDRQLAGGADPYYLFSMIVFQFRNMLTPNRAGVHPFAAQKARLAARHFEPGRLPALYQSLHRLELDAKNGVRDITDGLYEFIFKL